MAQSAHFLHGGLKRPLHQTRLLRVHFPIFDLHHGYS
jgi:hypothetical protein